MKILIKNGHVIDPAAKVDSRQDLLIEDGRIAAVGADAARAEISAEQVIDAGGGSSRRDLSTFICTRILSGPTAL